MNFYENLCEVCRIQGIPVSSAVVEAGEKLGSLGGWKKGAMPNSKAVVALALRLNVSADRLLGLPSQGIDIEERALLGYFRQCSESDRAALLDLAGLYAEREQASKSKRAE